MWWYSCNMMVECSAWWVSFSVFGSGGWTEVTALGSNIFLHCRTTCRTSCCWEVQFVKSIWVSSHLLLVSKKIKIRINVLFWTGSIFFSSIKSNEMNLVQSGTELGSCFNCPLNSLSDLIYENKSEPASELGTDCWLNPLASRETYKNPLARYQISQEPKSSIALLVREFILQVCRAGS